MLVHRAFPLLVPQLWPSVFPSSAVLSLVDICPVDGTTVKLKWNKNIGFKIQITFGLLYSRHLLSRHSRDLTKMSRYPNVNNGMLKNSFCV